MTQPESMGETIPEDGYALEWTDHYRFNLRKGGKLAMVDVPCEMLGLTCSALNVVRQNERPASTFVSWLQRVFG